MKASKLKVGDKIELIAVPGEGIPDYYIHPSTVRVYKKIIARNRPVRIGWINATSIP
ncbi:MAG TPA: hypothetical protein VJZ71_20530 [Phycisphaerae bacterium]|nr:hypothetical protein [Phycisphaerae bacterium]